MTTQLYPHRGSGVEKETIILRPQWILQKEVDDLKSTVKELEFRMQNIGYSTNCLLQSDFVNRGFQDVCKERVNDLNTRLKRVQDIQKMQLLAKDPVKDPRSPRPSKTFTINPSSTDEIFFHKVNTTTTTTDEEEVTEKVEVKKVEVEKEFKGGVYESKKVMMFELGKEGEYHYITLYFTNPEDLTEVAEKMKLAIDEVNKE